VQLTVCPDVARPAQLARSMSDAEVVRAIFEQFDADKDGRLNMLEYGLFLKSISYSKAWTEAQWHKECGLIGGDAEQGVSVENMSTLYTKFRAAKLRIDYANANALPGEEVRKLMDEARRANGGAIAGGGATDAAGRIAGESQMLAAADMADSKLSPDEYKRMQGMLGGSTAKGTKVLAKLSGVTEKLEKDSFDANQTLVVMGCNDCVVEVDTTCVKVFLQMCRSSPTPSRRTSATTVPSISKRRSGPHRWTYARAAAWILRAARTFKQLSQLAAMTWTSGSLM
jgi:hypothetical protein